MYVFVLICYVSVIVCHYVYIPRSIKILICYVLFENFRLRNENQIVFFPLNPIELLLVFYPVLKHGQRSRVVKKKYDAYDCLNLSCRICIHVPEFR